MDKMSYDILCLNCGRKEENRSPGSKVYKRNVNNLLPSNFDFDRDYEIIDIEESRYIAMSCQCCGTQYYRGQMYVHHPIITFNY